MLSARFSNRHLHQLNRRVGVFLSVAAVDEVCRLHVIRSEFVLDS